MQRRLVESLHPAVDTHPLALDETQPVRDVGVEAAEPLRPKVVWHADLPKVRQRRLSDRFPVRARAADSHAESIPAQVSESQLVFMTRCFQHRHSVHTVQSLKRRRVVGRHADPLASDRVLVLLSRESHRSARHARVRERRHHILRGHSALLDERISVRPSAAWQVAGYLFDYKVFYVCPQDAARSRKVGACRRQVFPRKAQSIVFTIEVRGGFSIGVAHYALTLYTQT